MASLLFPTDECLVVLMFSSQDAELMSDEGGREGGLCLRKEGGRKEGKRERERDEENDCQGNGR